MERGEESLESVEAMVKDVRGRGASYDADSNGHWCE